ncbi:hypothetical protein CISIN_1g044812mg, partial [Citrus sinensis]
MILSSARNTFALVTSRNYTSATVQHFLQVSATHRSLKLTKQSHSQILSLGHISNPFVSTKLITAYALCGQPTQSQLVFNSIQHKDVYLYNSLINGYVKNHGHNEALELFSNMYYSNVSPDDFTLATISKLSGEIKDLNVGMLIHGLSIKIGFVVDVILANSLMSMYVKCGKFSECLNLFDEMPQRNVGSWNVRISGHASSGDFSLVVRSRRVFDQMKRRNVYAWTAMINGYVQNGDLDEALVLFLEMQLKDRIEPNKVSLVSVLPTCSSLIGLSGGKQIHGFAIRKELNHDVSLCNALIDMYSKCGSLDCARRVFEDSSFNKDAITWSSIVSGYGLHGKGHEAVLLYNKMVCLGSKPDIITIVGVLSACGRSGLINEGLEIYNSVINTYRIKPTTEICACVVDMLGRAGQLDRALDFIKTMPVEPSPSIWGALVSASVMHGNSEMQDLAYKSLIQLEPENPSNYVSLSNLYASSRRWDAVAELRTMMKDRGLKKSPGCSWISIHGKTHCFSVADKAHPCSVSIYEMLDDLILIMRGAAASPHLGKMT